MAARDPQTGQFVSSSESYDDIEVATFEADIGAAAADLDGLTDFDGEFADFEGHLVIDYDDLVDRNEELHLLSAQHGLNVYQNSTATADGTVRAYAEVSSSPSRSILPGITTASLQGDTTDGAGVVGGQASFSDTIDVIGRPMEATAHGPFSDGATGVGGGGSAGSDSVEVHNPPTEMARFHPRDELFVNGRFNVWNISDAGIHITVVGQHVYGVADQ